MRLEMKPKVKDEIAVMKQQQRMRNQNARNSRRMMREKRKSSKQTSKNTVNETKVRNEGLDIAEREKTKRSLGRGGTIGTVTTGGMLSGNQTKQETAREETKRIVAAQQYAELINGEQNSDNTVNPNDNTGDNTSITNDWISR